MSTLPLMRSKHLLPFAAVLRNQGESVERLLKKSGLPGTCLCDPSMLVPVGAASRFRELGARRCGLPNIALAATAQIEIADLGEFGQRVLEAPTLHRALSEVCTLTEAETSNISIDLQPHPSGFLSVSHRTRSKIGVGEWHRALYTLNLLLKIVRLAKPTWSPSEIWIDAKASQERLEAIESLGSTARFGKRSTGFLVPGSLLALSPVNTSASQYSPNVNGEQSLSAPLAKTYAEALKQMIRTYASDGWLGIEQASEVASTSVRSMQRRLSAEQTTYSKVVEQLRSEMAGEFLETTDVAIAEIARELGYEHHSDFTRAFHRWAGVSPSEFRHRQRAN